MAVTMPFVSGRYVSEVYAIFTRMMVPQRSLLLSGLLLLALISGCAASGLERTTVTLGGHELRVWVADTAEERSEGLQAVDALEAGEGMLFIREEPEIITFGIKGVEYPVEVVFFAEDGTVSGIESLVPGEMERLVSSPSAARYALELPAGWCEASGVGRGSILIVE